MRKYFALILFTIFLVACSTPTTVTPTSTRTNIPTIVPSNLSTMEPTQVSKTILISAHRGGAGLQPENTLAAFQNGIALGADFIEMDLHLTQDGVPVVIHDPTVERTTDGKGNVSALLLSQLQAFNAAAKFSGAKDKQVVPTFAQVLDLTQPTNVQMEVEIKTDAAGKRYPGIEQKVLDAIAARGMLERVRIMAFEFDTLKQIRALNAKVSIIALVTTDYFRTHDLSQPAAIAADLAFADGIGVNATLLTPQLAQEAHARKLAVGVWTVDTASDMRKFIAMNVDSITTNRPDILMRALGR